MWNPAHKRRGHEVPAVGATMLPRDTRRQRAQVNPGDQEKNKKREQDGAF